MNNRRGNAPRSGGSFDDFDRYDDRRYGRRDDIGGMMRADTYKSMRSGDLDALGDDFDDFEDMDETPRRPLFPSRPKEKYVPTKTAAHSDVLFDEMADDDFYDIEPEPVERDDFADYNYGFSDFDPQTRSGVRGGARTLEEYRRARGEKEYTVREEVRRPAPPSQPRRPAPPRMADEFEDDFDAPVRPSQAAYSDGFTDDFDDDLGAPAPGSFSDGFSDDFDDDFDAPVRAARPVQPRRPTPPKSSSSHLTEEQRELVRRRPQGMPEFYAQYLVSGDVDERRKSKMANARRNRFKRTAMLAGSIVAAAAIIIGGIVYFTSKPKNPIEVRSGVREADSEVLFNMLKQSVDSKLNKESVSINVGKKSYTMKLADYDFAYAAPGTAEIAYNDIFSGSEVIGKETLISDGSIVFNETKVKKLLTDLAATQGDTMIEPYYKIEGDKMTVYAGTDGVGIEYNDFVNAVKDRIRKSSDEAIEANVHTIEAPAVDMDKIYAEVACEPKDASTSTSATGEMIFIDEVVGKDFDAANAKQIVAGGGKSWTITLALTQPKVTKVQLRAPYCLDLLSSWASKFNSKANKARASNIKIAAEKINGTIIQPGERFSFNSVVGPRTIENGFSYATVYTSEGADTGVGGGVCQVSSTVYYTALLCNLHIPREEDNEEDGRRNHMFTVSYMEVLGTDATVSYPWPDLYIVNDKEYPIKIVMYVEGDKLHCEYWGTADGYSCTIRGTSSNWTKAQTVYRKPNDKHKAGTKTNGAPGYTVTTKRNVFKDGKLMYTKTEEVSVYSPLNKVIYTESLPAGGSWG